MGMRPKQGLENTLFAQGYGHIAGVDEVGRGALAGPIVAAAVVLPPAPRLRYIRDSKSLSAQQRERLYRHIIKITLHWSVAIVSAVTIDSRGIAWANREVIQQAVMTLPIMPEHILIDGIDQKFGFPKHISIQNIIDGDQKIYSIAAASIVAKVTRDALMRIAARHYPQYAFEKHKGYGTFLHYNRLQQHGPCLWHRKSFLTLASKFQPQTKVLVKQQVSSGMI